MDCMEGLRDTPDKFYELAIVDPPYGENYTEWDKRPDANYFDELFRVSREQIIWGYNYFSDLLPSCKAPVLWDKENGETTTADGELAWTSFNGKLKIFRFFWWSNMMKAYEKPIIHPNQKPKRLYKWLLTKYAKQGDKILDTHLGSGSIAIACYDLGFSLTGYEIDKDYFEAMTKRFEKHKQQLTLCLK